MHWGPVEFGWGGVGGRGNGSSLTPPPLPLGSADIYTCTQVFLVYQSNAEKDRCSDKLELDVTPESCE